MKAISSLIRASPIKDESTIHSPFTLTNAHFHDIDGINSMWIWLSNDQFWNLILNEENLIQMKWNSMWQNSINPMARKKISVPLDRSIWTDWMLFYWMNRNQIILNQVWFYSSGFWFYSYIHIGWDLVINSGCGK